METTADEDMDCMKDGRPMAKAGMTAAEKKVGPRRLGSGAEVVAAEDWLSHGPTSRVGELSPDLI